MRVFLGGTCNGSQWKDNLIPLLNIDYFNSVVEDWTEDCMEEELRQRKICNLCLYTITPKMTGVYAIAEVVDDSNKRPDRTILVLLKNDEKEVFSDSQWKSLGAVARMVESNGATVFYSLKDCSEFINSKNTVEKQSYESAISQAEKRCRLLMGDE